MSENQLIVIQNKENIQSIDQLANQKINLNNPIISNLPKEE